MRIIIFAGGIGTRLWPLSRKNSPKQFDKIFNGKSTLELAIERVEPICGVNNIFVQTTAEFADAVRAQIPTLPEQNIFLEPCRRNVGPAVCYGMMRLQNANQREWGNLPAQAGESTRMDGNNDETVALLWADHLMERVEEFQKALKLGNELIKQNPERFIFLAERPRFANNNLGWIKVGEKIGEINRRDAPRHVSTINEYASRRDAINRVSTTAGDYFEFSGWKYKPEKAECDRMFKSGDYFWNPGYFISSVEFILTQYEKLAPEIYGNVKKSIENPDSAREHYEKAEKVSFDRAVIEKTDLSKAVVIKTNMGWSDPGTLYALKEALETSRDADVISGNVIKLNTKDSLLYNFEDKKILAAVGLDGFVVINTEDAIIVVPKEEVVRMTELVEKIGDLGLEEYL